MRSHRHFLRRRNALTRTSSELHVTLPIHSAIPSSLVSTLAYVPILLTFPMGTHVYVHQASQVLTVSRTYDSLKPDTCWHEGMLLNDGTIAMRYLFVEGRCIEINSTDFFCNYTRGHTGLQCEQLVNYCQQVTCYNQGVCVSTLVDYTCQCISTSYSGRHCENVAGSVVLRQYVSRTLGYIAIIAIVLVAAFVLMMDLLKYGFGVDPVGEERERNRRRKVIGGRKFWRDEVSHVAFNELCFDCSPFGFFSLRRRCHVVQILFPINTPSKVVIDLLFLFADVANLLGTRSTSRRYYSFHTWIGVWFYSLTRSRLVVKTDRSLITVLWPVDRRE